MKIFMP